MRFCEVWGVRYMLDLKGLVGLCCVMFDVCCTVCDVGRGVYGRRGYGMMESGGGGFGGRECYNCLCASR